MPETMRKLFPIIFMAILVAGCSSSPKVPFYLNEYQEQFCENPREANLEWFKDAGYGMFIHYGLYSLLEKGEWVQLRDTIPVAEYARLMERFRAENFSADKITDIAIRAGMKYITITAKHHDGFCLFDTKATDFNVKNSPAGRDLIGELYEACEQKGLGLFLYYSYGADWKHPYFYSRESGWENARPAYKEAQPEYLFEKEKDFSIYVDFVHTQLREILGQYPNIAGIWFDPIMGYYSRPDLFPVDSTYALIRKLSPHALISFKQGANGTEDFVAPERGGNARVGQQFEVARAVYELNKDKPREICNTLQPHAWGYNRQHDGHHKSAENILEMLRDARRSNANLLLNVGPKGDGSFPDEDISALEEAGERVGEVMKPPNIICILVDDLGYGDLACLGATDMRTPHIDGLAAQGLTFTSFYANCTVCSPSRASLLTGKYPDMVGVPGVIRQFTDNSWGNLADDAVTIAEVLKSAGYRTGMVGKWHLGFERPDIPNDRGFDFFKGFLGDMMDDYWTHLRGGVNWMRENREEISPVGHATDLFTDWSIKFLKEQKEEEQAFFLYLAYNAPHFPIQPPQEWLDRVQEREPDLPEKRAKNVAFIEHLDFNVGRVMQTLEETGLDENTLVLFTSDNGGALRFAQSNGRLRGGKQDMYEGGIRVPALCYWKGNTEPGTSTDQVAMLMDLFPTFCEAAGAELPDGINGTSILGTICGMEQDIDNRFLFWVRREGGVYGGQAYHAARYLDHKILQNTPFEPIQYFNLGADELEKNPLDPSEDEIYEKLRSQLQDHIRKSGSVPWQ